MATDADPTGAGDGGSVDLHAANAAAEAIADVANKEPEKRGRKFIRIVRRGRPSSQKTPFRSGGFPRQQDCPKDPHLRAQAIHASGVVIHDNHATNSCFSTPQRSDSRVHRRCRYDV